MSSDMAVAKILGERLGLDFGTAKRSLDSWGEADRCIELSRNVWLLLEVEGTQHHPNTNVLKLWPFLEKHPERCVWLVQAFGKDGKNRVSSRGRLAAWLAEKMRDILGMRFRYYRVVVDLSLRQIEGADDLAADLARIRRRPTSRIVRVHD